MTAQRFGSVLGILFSHQVVSDIRTDFWDYLHCSCSLPAPRYFMFTEVLAMAFGYTKKVQKTEIPVEMGLQATRGVGVYHCDNPSPSGLF